jgi:DnaJ-class molecular chaperone
MTYTWYPGKRTIAIKLEQSKPCPICEGKGTRIDKRTHKERMCVGCKGTGII